MYAQEDVFVFILPSEEDQPPIWKRWSGQDGKNIKRGCLSNTVLAQVLIGLENKINSIYRCTYTEAIRYSKNKLYLPVLLCLFQEIFIEIDYQFGKFIFSSSKFLPLSSLLYFSLDTNSFTSVSVSPPVFIILEFFLYLTFFYLPTYFLLLSCYINRFNSYRKVTISYTVEWRENLDDWKVFT